MVSQIAHLGVSEKATDLVMALSLSGLLSSTFLVDLASPICSLLVEGCEAALSCAALIVSRLQLPGQIPGFVV